MDPSNKDTSEEHSKLSHPNNNPADVEVKDDMHVRNNGNIPHAVASVSNVTESNAYSPDARCAQVDVVPLYVPATMPLVIDASTNIPSRSGLGQSTSISILRDDIQPPNPIPLLQIHTSTSSGNTSVGEEVISPPKVDYYAPPPYDVATDMAKLPTYEEVEREKRLENEEFQVPINAPAAILPAYAPPGQRILTIDNESTDEIDTSLLGTDFMFCIAFFVAFVFNWIGFLLLMCFCHTIASRYGALSGFGLSLAKWTFIVQHSTELASKDNGWLWWLIMTFGLVVCVRALLQYLNIKRSWPLLSASHKERLLFFY